jgi:hypothetical protein
MSSGSADYTMLPRSKQKKAVIFQSMLPGHPEYE